MPSTAAPPTAAPPTAAPPTAAARVAAGATAAQVRAWARRDLDPAVLAEEAAEEAFAETAELIPDLDADPGDGADAWENGQGAEWARLVDADDDLPQALRGCFPAGLCPRDTGQGGGFAAGGVADRLAPGVVLAGLTGDTWRAGLGAVSDDELIGVLRAWHRLGSWAAAGELAAVGELARRRDAEVAAGANPRLAEHVGDELAMSLTLTGRAADGLLDFACGLARLPLTAHALADGVIDRGRAQVIVDELGYLDDPALARLVEARVIGRAARQTTAKLRAAARHAVLDVDPEAAKRRREKARKQARVEVWDERSGGTAALAGRDLPPADVLAADKRIDTLARHLRASGAEGTMDQLRARVYVALLLDQPIEPPTPVNSNPAHAPGTTPDSGGSARAHHAPNDTPCPTARSAGLGRGLPAEWPAIPAGGVGATVNLTMPLAAWLGTSSTPGEAAGFGPIPAGDARALAQLAAAQPGSRWCLTFTDQTGRAVAHGCATARDSRSRRTANTARFGTTASQGARAGGNSGSRGTSETGHGYRDGPHGDRNGQHGDWELSVTIRPIAVGTCLHLRETPNYRPSPSLYHIVNVRQRRCSFPGCRRHASRCDADHTIPYDQGGRTCECNVAPLCRRHHQAKQVHGWRLDQPEPGVLIWRPPHGRTYRAEPDPYPGTEPGPGTA